MAMYNVVYVMYREQIAEVEAEQIELPHFVKATINKDNHTI